MHSVKIAKLDVTQTARRSLMKQERVPVGDAVEGNDLGKLNVATRIPRSGAGIALRCHKGWQNLMVFHELDEAVLPDLVVQVLLDAFETFLTNHATTA